MRRTQLITTGSNFFNYPCRLATDQDMVNSHTTKCIWPIVISNLQEQIRKIVFTRLLSASSSFETGTEGWSQFPISFRVPSLRLANFSKSTLFWLIASSIKLRIFFSWKTVRGSHFSLVNSSKFWLISSGNVSSSPIASFLWNINVNNFKCLN